MRPPIGSKVKIKPSPDTERLGIAGATATVVAHYPGESTICVIETGKGPENRFHIYSSILEPVEQDTNIIEFGSTAKA
jgi:hypothetical protein